MSGRWNRGGRVVEAVMVREKAELDSDCQKVMLPFSNWWVKRLVNAALTGRGQLRGTQSSRLIDHNDDCSSAFLFQTNPRW